LQPDVFQNNLVVAEKLEAIAKQKEVTPAQLVLAWIMYQWEVSYACVQLVHIADGIYRASIQSRDLRGRKVYRRLWAV
jgi:diketogulonate reductase-like aldo/keto reductase